TTSKLGMAVTCIKKSNQAACSRLSCMQFMSFWPLGARRTIGCGRTVLSCRPTEYLYVLQSSETCARSGHHPVGRRHDLRILLSQAGRDMPGTAAAPDSDARNTRQIP